jgi:hypothetical protein
MVYFILLVIYHSLVNIFQPHQKLLYYFLLCILYQKVNRLERAFIFVRVTIALTVSPI